ncbi:MAG: NAD-binding protein [Anaerolineales bacterium]|jgi:trk system potassium uptake protein TrkA
MYVLVAGGGRTGTQLAQYLLNQDYQVRVLEHRPQVLTSIHRELPTEVILEGNATDVVILDEAGASRADVLAACTANDEDNLTVCYLARQRYDVPRTIARVNNPRNAWLFNETFHVDVALNNAAVMARLIEEEMSLGDMMTLLKLRRGDYSLVEEKIPPGAPAVGVAIKDLELPASCAIAAIIRNGEMVVPRGDVVFEVDDEVMAVTDRAGAAQLAALFEKTGRKRA